MFKIILIGVGLAFLLAGLLTFWLPLPIGLPLAVVGAVLLTRHSPHARNWLLSASSRIPPLQRALKRMSGQDEDS